MSPEEIYEFDRSGYLVIPQLLNAEDCSALAAATDKVLADAEANLNKPPMIKAKWGSDYHRNEALGYHVTGGTEKGNTVIIEDFFNADSAYDILINHAPTMHYITTIIHERPAINNSEIRVRYQDNATGMHMGGPVGSKYRYHFVDNKIDCMMVRMIYFIQDVCAEQGAFCVVPGTHKSNMNSPYQGKPEDDPGMIPLEVKAGDAILFTENLRHGGVANHSDQVRKTLHVGYGPFWLKSQNISTMDEDPYILESTKERYDEQQKRLFYPYELEL